MLCATASLHDGVNASEMSVLPYLSAINRCLPLVQDLFRLLDQREQEKMEWDLLEGRVDGRTKAPTLSLSHGLVRQFNPSETAGCRAAGLHPF